MELVALVARYHRGRPPGAAVREFASLSSSARRIVLGLSGILRLAQALDRDGGGRPMRLHVTSGAEAVRIEADLEAPGATPREALRKKWLLELACARPVMVQFARSPRFTDAA